MADTIDITIPDLGDFSEVEVIEVLVNAGDHVDREDGLITLETDKASMDVPATQHGTIDELTVKVGDKVSTGDVIGSLKVEVGDTVVVTPAIEANLGQGDTTVVASPDVDAEAISGKHTLSVPNLGDFSDVDVIEVHISAGDDVAIEDPLITLDIDALKEFRDRFNIPVSDKDIDDVPYCKPSPIDTVGNCQKSGISQGCG